jgi:lipopolysaccharide biosynthesis glycosyltransferase
MLLVCAVLIIAQIKITTIEKDYNYLNTTMACLDEHQHLDHHDRTYICRIDDQKLTELANKYNYQYYHENNIIYLSWPITTWE